MGRPPQFSDAETRREEDVAWRSKIREEDLAWRQTGRREDVEARERNRLETLRVETRRAALVAASRSGAPEAEIYALAERYIDWIEQNSIDKATN